VGRDRLRLRFGGKAEGLSYNLAGTARDLAFGFTYNPAGQILSRSMDNDFYAWTASTALSRPYAVDGQNQYTSASRPTTLATASLTKQ
jgi:hypothetical protein